MPMTDLSAARPITFIITRNRAASEAFYAETLGLARMPGDDFAAVYDLGGVALLRVTEVADFLAGAHPALGWEVLDIAATMQGLADKGVVPTIYDGYDQDALGIWTSPDGAAKVAWFNDPDGNVLSLTQF
jgi:catechol 2,3-dioxygenase-like lactoylglutathione lyase family enzyme